MLASTARPSFLMSVKATVDSPAVSHHHYSVAMTTAAGCCHRAAREMSAVYSARLLPWDWPPPPPACFSLAVSVLVLQSLHARCHNRYASPYPHTGQHFVHNTYGMPYLGRLPLVTFGGHQFALAVAVQRGDRHCPPDRPRPMAAGCRAWGPRLVCIMMSPVVEERYIQLHDAGRGRDDFAKS